MKRLMRNPEMFFKTEGDGIKAILVDQEADEYFELDGHAAWIIQDALEGPGTREDLMELAVEDFEDLPEDYEKEFNAIIDELIALKCIIEEDG